MTYLNPIRLLSTTALCLLILAGCGDKNSAEGEAAPYVAETNPLAKYAGDWMAEAFVGDATEPVNAVILKATTDPETWSMKFTHLDEPVGFNSVVVMGDTVVSKWGPFSSGLREGVTVEEMTSYMAVNGDMLSGRAVGVYSDGSIVHFRMKAKRAN